MAPQGTQRAAGNPHSPDPPRWPLLPSPPRHAGELLRGKDAGRATADLQRCLLPLLLPLTLSDTEEVSRGAVVAAQRLAALLPRDAAAASAQAGIAALEARGGEDAAIAAARVFAHTAASWSEAALRARAPELLRRWCGHRDFAVREVRGWRGRRAALAGGRGGALQFHLRFREPVVYSVAAPAATAVTESPPLPRQRRGRRRSRAA